MQHNCVTDRMGGDGESPALPKAARMLEIVDSEKKRNLAWTVLISSLLLLAVAALGVVSNMHVTHSNTNEPNVKPVVGGDLTEDTTPTLERAPPKNISSVPEKTDSVVPSAAANTHMGPNVDEKETVSGDPSDVTRPTLERQPPENTSLVPPKESEIVISKQKRNPVKGAIPFDFAILGFPKCASTFLRKYLSGVKDIYVAPKEQCDFQSHTKLHELFDGRNKFFSMNATAAASAKVRGFKCPILLETKSNLKTAMRLLFTNKSTFIVQIRHPVDWFQSYYNYMMKVKYPEKLLPVEKLPSSCDKHAAPYITGHGSRGIRNACTDRSNFHYALSRLGKTPMTSADELRLLNNNGMSLFPVHGKVFLIEISQFDDPHVADQLRIDLASFLGMPEQSFPAIKTGFKGGSNHQEAKGRVNPVDICDKKYADVRARLVANGKRASEWIQKYFLESPEVVSSSKPYILEKLHQWGNDPCKGK